MLLDACISFQADLQFTTKRADADLSGFPCLGKEGDALRIIRCGKAVQLTDISRDGVSLLGQDLIRFL